jgi:hypothetical protein
MGVRKVCTDGYVVEQCRCAETHAVTIVPCAHNAAPDRHHMEIYYGDVMEEETRVCERCSVEHLEKDFRGSICGWCADDLEDLEKARQS